MSGSACSIRVALDVRIEVRDVDEERPARVGGLGDGAGELLLADRRADRDDLTRLDVRAVDGELGEGVEAVVHRQAIVAAARTRCE